VGTIANTIELLLWIT